MSRQLMMLVGCVVLTVSVARAGLLAVPEKYTPAKSWPVIVSTQDNPDPELTKKTDYFLVHAGGQGAACTTKIRSELLSLAARYNIDPFRIYGTGFSRGGQEIEIQAWQHPDWFAAIAPVCSDLREKPDRNDRHLNVQYLQNVPTLMLHGTGDSFRDEGQIEFDLAKKAGVPVTWQTYQGGHSPAVPFKQNVKLLTDFFDKHKLDPYPKEVTHLVESNRLRRAFWADCSLVKETPTVKGVYKVKVKDGNVIAVETNEHIATLALALNDKLVDMSKPVKVVAGDKTLYEGPAKERLVVKIRDGEAYTPTEEKPLWQEIQAVRAKAGEGKGDKADEGTADGPVENRTAAKKDQ
jgi:dienelactone hydrolase